MDLPHISYLWGNGERGGIKGQVSFIFWLQVFTSQYRDGQPVENNQNLRKLVVRLTDSVSFLNIRMTISNRITFSLYAHTHTYIPAPPKLPICFDKWKKKHTPISDK